MTSEPVGVVLAGGMGRRIGGSKATVELAGRPLLCYPLDAMGEVLSERAMGDVRGTVRERDAPFGDYGEGPRTA